MLMILVEFSYILRAYCYFSPARCLCAIKTTYFSFKIHVRSEHVCQENLPDNEGVANLGHRT